MSTGKPAIVIFQSCDEFYEPFLDATKDSNSIYATLHGYSYHAHVGNIAPAPQTANYNRYYLLRDAITSGKFDWALWLDADAIVVDHEKTLESVIDASPDKLIIACRGGLQGDHDINNGVFFLNLRNPLAYKLVEACISHCENLGKDNAEFVDDQWILHKWLYSLQDPQGRIPVVQNYSSDQYNLFNYDGKFIRHVLRECGNLEFRINELKRLARLALSSRNSQNVTFAAMLQNSGERTASSRRCEMSEPGSFQQQNRILVCSPASYLTPPPYSLYLIESCQKFGIELTLLGQGQPYRNNRQKVEMVADYLCEHPAFRYVLMVDFCDVIFCATLREIFHKYLSFEREIVISAERFNAPVPMLGSRCPETGTSYRYVNSGSIFSTSSAWLLAWKAMQEREREFGGVAPENPNGANIFTCDQAAWIDLYVHGLAEIALDAECRMFQVFAGVDSRIYSNNPDLDFEGRRIINRETGARPCLVHGCGSIPLTHWKQYILGSNPVWNWPHIQRLRQTAIGRLLEQIPMEQLLLELGLNLSLIHLLPNDLMPYSGKGLEIDREPQQFAAYLIWLARRDTIRSYAEFNIKNCGVFITTLEYLRRFHPVQLAVGVDQEQSEACRDYFARTEGTNFVRRDSDSESFPEYMRPFERFDLVSINLSASIETFKRDWEFARNNSRYVAIHNIGDAVPEAKSLWSEIQTSYLETNEFMSRDLTSGQFRIGVVTCLGKQQT